MGKTYEWWTRKDIALLRNNYKHLGNDELLKMFPDRTLRSIHGQAERFKIRKREKLPPNKLERLLENTPEAYMRIGFLFADGCISHDKYKKLDLECSAKDEQYVKDFANFIGVTVRYRQRKDQKIKMNKMISFRAYKPNVVDAIIKKFDFRKKKTYFPPKNLNIKNNDLFVSMFIGYIDGDGSIDEKGRLKVKCHASWERVLNKWFARIWQIAGCEIVNDKMSFPKCEIVQEEDYRGLFKRSKMAVITTSNPQFMMFLKNKIKELKLPVLKRKWDRVKDMDQRKRNICEMNKYQNEKDVIRMHKQGLTSFEMAKKLNLTQTTINDVKRKYKLYGNGKRKYNWLNWDTVNKIREEFKTNKNRMDLCQKYDVSYFNLGSILSNRTWNERTREWKNILKSGDHKRGKIKQAEREK